MQLAGKNALVTGAAHGIGHQLCLELSLKQGVKVWAADIDRQALDELAQKAKKMGGEIIPVILDVTNEDSVKKVLQEINKDQSRIDLWINNAGIAHNAKFMELDDASFAKTFAVNFFAVVQCTRIALAQMESFGAGTIVNVASVAGHVPAPYMTSYVSSKHAVVGFTRSLQAELTLNQSPINLHLVSPGFVDTRILKKGEALGFPPWLNWLLSSPEAVAKAIVSGIKKGQREISPTLNGKMMLKMNWLSPGFTIRGSKVLLAKSFKDVFLNRYDP